MNFSRDSLLKIAHGLRERRGAIVADWCSRVLAHPQISSGASLPIARLQDHIPALLEDFERRLEEVAAGSPHGAAPAADAAAHGLHRWQEGFELTEVTRELGQLNLCMVDALEACALAQPQLDAAAVAQARRSWAELYGVVVYASTAEFFKLRQAEARGHAAELEQALESLRALEHQRAVLWQQAAHDLRGNLGGVAMATAGLATGSGSPDVRVRLVGSLERNVRALHRLLEDVTSLARLQSGQEQRELGEVDVAALLLELRDSLQIVAGDRKLTLDFDGPPGFTVVGDAVKLRRIVQNLALNAIKYTRRGGVAVHWGGLGADDPQRWFVQVRDTGPGFDAGSGAALAQALGAAMQVAKSTMAATDPTGAPAHFASAQVASATAELADPSASAAAGEGIGLSIVKRLCNLLDGTIEFESAAGRGTTFRILLPKDYPVRVDSFTTE